MPAKRIAAPRRLLARRARRDRPLGAAEADHRLACASASPPASPRRPPPASAACRPTRSSRSGTGWSRPISALFAWLEGRGPRPEATDPAPFRPVMLSHPIEDGDFDKLDPGRLAGRMEMGRHPRPGRQRHATPTARASTRLYLPHRRGHRPGLSRSRRGADAGRRARRRIAGDARGRRCRASTPCSSASTARP